MTIDRPPISLEAISVKFGDFQALNDISLEFPRGKISGVLGPNGAGKTTLLRSILHLQAVSSGRILVLGTPRFDLDVLRHLGVSLHQPAIYSRLTVDENLQFHATIAGASRSDAKRLASRAIDRFDLRDIAQSRGAYLSFGERRRVDLARAIMNDPSIVILDEPTAGVDVMSVRAIRDILQSLASDGKTIVITTHEVNEAERLFEYVAIIHRGRLVSQGATRDISENSRIHIYDISVRSEVSLPESPAGLVARLVGQRQIEVRAHDDLAVARYIEALEVAGAGDCVVMKHQNRLEDAFVEIINRENRG